MRAHASDGPATRLGERDPRSAPEVELRETVAGQQRHVETVDHHINVLTGPPVRLTCGSNFRSVRTPGDIYVMPAGASDVWTEDDASTAIDLRLPTSLVRRVAEDLGLDPDRAGIAAHHQLRDAQIEHIAWALVAERRAGSPSGRLYREGLGVALAAHMLGRYAAVAAPRRGLSRPQLRRVTEFIEAHLDDDLSLARLASVAGVSASHFKTLFKRTVGTPVHAYVIQRRVERARALLARGELSASQVALEVGFSHQSHMARWMRRVLGVSPSAVARRA